MPEPLQLLTGTDSDQIREALSVWRNAMEQHGRKIDSLWWLPEGKVYFRVEGTDFKFGLDPTGKNWTVELNEPSQDGKENRLSGVARDQAGRRYLLRQGRLHANAQSNDIDEFQFVRRTGLKPDDVTIDGKPAKRRWFIVTALDISATDICQNTAAFVDRCSLARDPDAAEAAKRDDERLTKLFAEPEQGGQISGQPTINLNQRHRIQGEVWQALHALLVADGRCLKKPKHTRGYAVDGEIETQAGKLLLEIKSGTTAADAYTGVGQLILYPKLLPQLSDHRRILLLPGSPPAALVAAIGECGVELHRYDLQEDGVEVHVTFSLEFLHLCGLGSLA